MPKKPDTPKTGEGRPVAKIILPKPVDKKSGRSGLSKLPQMNKRQHQRRGGKPPRFPGRTGGR